MSLTHGARYGNLEAKKGTLKKGFLVLFWFGCLSPYREIETTESH